MQAGFSQWKMCYFKAPQIKAYWHLKYKKKLWWRPSISPLSVPRGWIFLPYKKKTETSAVRRSHTDPWTHSGSLRNLRERRTELGVVRGEEWDQRKKVQVAIQQTGEKLLELKEKLFLMSLPILAVYHEFLFLSQKNITKGLSANLHVLMLLWSRFCCFADYCSFTITLID